MTSEGIPAMRNFHRIRIVGKQVDNETGPWSGFTWGPALYNTIYKKSRNSSALNIVHDTNYMKE